MKNKINLKQGNFLLSEECAQYAEKFMKTAIGVETPMALADLFCQNSYLNENLNRKGDIFYNALDLTAEVKNGIFHLLEDKQLLLNIYTLAFWDYAKKNNFVKKEDADKFAKSLVEFA